MQAGDIIAERFRLDQKLGSGGVGVVWRAEDLRTREPVAIKVLKSPTGDAVRRFEKEARALAQLDHPAIVKINEYGRTPSGEPFLAMEHVAGQPLAAVRGTACDIAYVIDVLAQVLGALAHAHQRGVAHRDLKPENIMITSAGQPRVLDFGLAKLTGLDALDFTKTGEVFGTPQYMSPEQLRGSRHAGPKSDVYAMGVLAFELLTGRLPYDGDSMLALAMGHLGQIPPEIGRDDCPVELKRLVADMLSKDAADRPTAVEALKTLDPSVSVSEPAAPRRDLLALAGGLLAAVIVLGIIAAVLVVTQDDDKPDVVPPGRSTGALIAQPKPPADPDPVPPQAVTTACAHDEGYHSLPRSLGANWRYYIPKGGVSEPRPVVVIMQTDRVEADEMIGDSGLATQADKHGVILLAPAAQPKDIADVTGETRSALDKLHRETCVDRDRIYVIGHGSGGDSAMELSCTGDVAAIAFAAYLPYTNEPFPRCSTPQPIPALHLMPKKSGETPFGGGVTKCRFTGPAMSALEVEEAWRQRNDCPRKKPTSRGTQGDGECFSWSRCAAPLSSCHIDGGKSWPGVIDRSVVPTAVSLAVGDCVGPVADFPYAEVAMDFLTQHRRRPAGCGQNPSVKSDSLHTVDIDGAERQMWMMLPDDYDSNRSYPVVLVVGHAHRDPRQFLKTRVKAAEPLRRAGYIVIAPMPEDKSAPWSAPSDDEFLRNVVSMASDKVCIDEGRVFGFAHSDGATRLRELACEIPFSGIALTGMAELDPPQTCKPLGPPPTIRVVGRDDDYIPLAGGRGCDQATKYLNADESDQIWTEQLGFGCRQAKREWKTRPDACDTWDVCETPYVSCRVDGGQFFGQTELNSPGQPMHHNSCPEKTTPFDLRFERTVLPFFDQHGRPIP